MSKQSYASANSGDRVRAASLSSSDVRACMGFCYGHLLHLASHATKAPAADDGKMKGACNARREHSDAVVAQASACAAAAVQAFFDTDEMHRDSFDYRQPKDATPNPLYGDGVDLLPVQRSATIQDGLALGDPDNRCMTMVTSESCKPRSSRGVQAQALVMSQELWLHRAAPDLHALL